MTLTLVIIGAGAAGLFAAIQAKQLQPALRVVVLEAAPKPLGKVKISGGGRCNVTHACFDPNTLTSYYPRGQKELKSVFSRFGPQQTIDWFKAQGIALKTEPDGRMFPVTDSSQTIIDGLLDAARQAGIELYCQSPVKQVHFKEDHKQFQVVTAQKTWVAQAVLLATGSSQAGYRLAESLGHTVIQPVPSLFTFHIQDARLEGLAGISVPHVQARLLGLSENRVLTEQEGPLLVTHWGLSGPVILKLSAWGARDLAVLDYHARLRVDFCPMLDRERLRTTLLAAKQTFSKKQVANHRPDALASMPKRLWERLLEASTLPVDKPWGEAPQKSLNKLAEMLKQAEFMVHGKSLFKEEFVTAGGIKLSEVDFKTMQSKRCAGLFFAGEVLDIDALTGGFNLQNAWSTGWVAGHGMADEGVIRGLS